MKRSKLANVGKGRRIKRDHSGAVMLSMDDIRVSLRTLVRNRYRTQTEAACQAFIKPEQNLNYRAVTTTEKRISMR